MSSWTEIKRLLDKVYKKRSGAYVGETKHTEIQNNNIRKEKKQRTNTEVLDLSLFSFRGPD